MPRRITREELALIWPKISEIFSASQTGLQGGPGPGEFTGGDDDGPDTGGGGGINGIQTEQGQDIETEQGQIIQAESQ